MANRKYLVREGYSFSDEAGRDYGAGEIVELDSEIGDTAHQLERLGRPAKPAPVAETPSEIQPAEPVADVPAEPAPEAPAESPAEPQA